MRYVLKKKLEDYISKTCYTDPIAYNLYQMLQLYPDKEEEILVNAVINLCEANKRLTQAVTDMRHVNIRPAVGL